MLLANLVWESGQLPLYTLWVTGPPEDLAFAVAHCTMGDLLIAMATLALSLITVGASDWPDAHLVRVAVMTTVLGVVYTIFSEWLNVSVRASWAYSPEMPLLPFLHTGLSPVLQWLLLPPLSLALACKGRKEDVHQLP